MALMPTLYSHIDAVFFIICILKMLVNVKLDVNCEWHSQNEVGNIAILVLWRDREKTLLGGIFDVRNRVSLMVCK